MVWSLLPGPISLKCSRDTFERKPKEGGKPKWSARLLSIVGALAPGTYRGEQAPRNGHTVEAVVGHRSALLRRGDIAGSLAFFSRPQWRQRKGHLRQLL